MIIFTEHYVFRKGNFANYDLDGWNDPKRLPIGIAAFTAFMLGVVAWVLGMVETCVSTHSAPFTFPSANNPAGYTGPLGGLIGTYGGDVANQAAFIVTGISYAPLRYLERKYVGR